MSLEIVQTLPQDLWRSFVDEHPHGNIFHTPDMFAVFQQATGYTPTLWAAVEQTAATQQIIALLNPVEVTILGGPLRPLTTRAIAYGSLLCHTDHSFNHTHQRALNTLLKTYAQRTGQRLLFTELRHLHNVSSLNHVLAQNGYHYSPHLNFLIDLDMPADDVWQNITKNGRKRLRNALNKGVTVETVQTQAQLDDWYTLLQMTYHRANIPLADKSLFQAVFDRLHPQKMAQFLLAKVDDTYAAASLEMPYKDIIYSWYAGFDMDYRRYAPNDVLVWHILEWGANHGYRFYDFGGAGHPDEDYGVRDFKAKYGGALVEFGRHQYNHAPHLLTLSTLGYAAYQKLKQVLT